MHKEMKNSILAYSSSDLCFDEELIIQFPDDRSSHNLFLVIDARTLRWLGWLPLQKALVASIYRHSSGEKYLITYASPRVWATEIRRNLITSIDQLRVINDDSKVKESFSKPISRLEDVTEERLPSAFAQNNHIALGFNECVAYGLISDSVVDFKSDDKMQMKILHGEKGVRLRDVGFDDFLDVVCAETLQQNFMFVWKNASQPEPLLLKVYCPEIIPRSNCFYVQDGFVGWTGRGRTFVFKWNGDTFEYLKKCVEPGLSEDRYARTNSYHRHGFLVADNLNGSLLIWDMVHGSSDQPLLKVSLPEWFEVENLRWSMDGRQVYVAGGKYLTVVDFGSLDSCMSQDYVVDLNSPQKDEDYDKDGDF
eukprot:TRINITY_DN1717_c0_g1_i7.p1 TRINITY_DN1717_c0_g1~~TRINITY_DN1717_c0_g1_i7.p1  ORF type:complete len:365 (-),score=72.85 TRINITY_DN1717_c0_g1_i7:16-1110(-)